MVKTFEEQVKDLGKKLSGKGSLCLVGPPGCGKTMLAREIAEHMVPKAEHEKAIRQVRQAMGIKPHELLKVPFRAPHHTASMAAMVGRRPDQDTAFPYYGELSLAHGGVLFLDELPEFRPDVLASVMQAGRDGEVIHGTRTGNVSYPAQWKLIVAMNPCPCGYGVGYPGRTCSCTSESVRRYKNRVKAIRELLKVVDLREHLPMPGERR